MNKSEQLWKSLEDEEYRRAFVVDDTGLAFQIKLLREKNGWTQQQLAERADSKQETISQWENPNYGRYTLKTLKGLATAFDVGLMVKFAPFSEVIEWNANLTPERLAPPSYAEERQAQQAQQAPQARVSLVFWTKTPGPAETVAILGALSGDATLAHAVTWLPSSHESDIWQTQSKEEPASAHRQTQSKKERVYAA